MKRMGFILSIIAFILIGCIASTHTFHLDEANVDRIEICQTGGERIELSKQDTQGRG